MRDLELPSAGMEPDACPGGPIGVFDSGLGGLTVLEAFRRRLPEQDFIYFGDNAHAPYGVKSPGEVYRLTVAGVQRLFDEGCRLVILACNTASAVALHDLQDLVGGMRNVGAGSVNGGDPGGAQHVIVLRRDHAATDHDDVAG